MTKCIFKLLACFTILPFQLLWSQGPTITCGDSTVQVTKFDGQDHSFPQGRGGGGIYAIDFNGDHIKEFSLIHSHYAGSSGIYSYTRVASADTGCFIHVELDTLFSLDSIWQDSMVLAVKRMNFGDLVSDTLNWHSGLFSIYENFLLVNGSYLQFSFEGGRGYVGLRVEQPGLSCTGWLEIKPIAEIYGYACNCTGPLALEPDHIEGSIQIGPNPSKGQFSIRYRPQKNGRYKIEIHDLFGRLVTSRSGIAQLNEHVSFFDLQDEPKGVYLVRVLQGKHKFQTRLVID